MAAPRGEFGSRFGFMMAAAGSAVGLGNIWGFPTEAASNGGAAFLLVYLVLAFCLAYPALMAELIIGRHSKANIVTALSTIANTQATRRIGVITGLAGLFTASVILSFYAIVAGWMLAYCLASLADIFQLVSLSSWLTEFGFLRNLVFMLLFMSLTIHVISGGVKEGIEKWSTRLMPMLIVILLGLIVYVLTLDGAMQGVKAYLIPDLSKISEPSLIINALGQSFFSMSLGVGTMLVYGSYVSRKENIVSLGRSVMLIDIGIAVTAGLLIIPAMYVAQENGVTIFNSDGTLIAEDTLIFTVLPALYDTMGFVGVFLSIAFFLLMSIAALTSSISMLEVPVAYAVEGHSIKRKHAAYTLGLIVTCMSALLVANFSALFGLAIDVSTKYAQPLLGLVICVFAGWIMHRSKLLAEIKGDSDQSENDLFWKIWPSYVRFVCPAAIALLFLKQFFS